MSVLCNTPYSILHTPYCTPYAVLSHCRPAVLHRPARCYPSTGSQPHAPVHDWPGSIRASAQSAQHNGAETAASRCHLPGSTSFATGGCPGFLFAPRSLVLSF